MRIVILGGGSAGWITAATLLARVKRPPLEITVIESPATPRIGVGEATIPTVRNMLAEFGMGEAEIFACCEATVKHGIRFDDWSGPGSQYYHPFHRYTDRYAAEAAVRWLDSDGSRPYAELVSAQVALIRQRKAPRPLAAAGYSGAVPYAYHLDAELFAEHLACRCERGGVRRVSAHIVEVKREAETGHVTSLHDHDGRSFRADFFVDCSGFRSLLSDRNDAGAEWIDQSRHLICDRAVTLRVPLAPDARPEAFTRARALGAGWCWDIGLRARRGRGYVYSSAHTSGDEAELALREEEGCGDEIEAQHLRFKVGRRREAWTGNVAAIGLSAGFLEPLESTGLYFAQKGARALADLLPKEVAHPAHQRLARRYSAVMADMHDCVLDFIQLHYAVAQRRDTAFWEDASHADCLTDRLRDLLQIWDMRPPIDLDIDPDLGPFVQANYKFILLGSGWRPSGWHPGQVGMGPHPATMTMLSALPSLDAFHQNLSADPTATSDRRDVEK